MTISCLLSQAFSSLYVIFPAILVPDSVCIYLKWSAASGKHVTIIEQKNDIALDETAVIRDQILERIRKCNVDIYTDTAVVRIDNDGVIIENNETEHTKIYADTIVTAIGSVSDDSLAKELIKEGCQVIIIGDAKRPALAGDAIREGYKTGLTICTNKFEGESNMKNILILTGSPREKGNSNTLAATFASAATAKGHTVEFIDTSKASYVIYKGSKEDILRLLDDMKWADVLVLVSPVYWKGFTSYIKGAIDRFIAFTVPENKELLSVKETCLIATAMAPDLDVFNPMVEEFKHIHELLGLKERNILLCPELDGPNDVEDHKEYLEAAIQMGMTMGDDDEMEQQKSDFSKQRMEKSVRCGWL